MRIYGSVQTCFWENTDTQQLSDQAKLLAIYLLTGPHSNMIGAIRLPEGYITEDLRWNTQVVKNAFQELSAAKFLTRDESNSWLVIHHFLKWNPVQNPKQGIGIQKLFDLIPTQSSVFKPLVKALLVYGKYFHKEFLDCLHKLEKSLETVFEDCLADKEQNQDQEQDQKKISMSGKRKLNVSEYASLKSQAMEILKFLNEKTGRAYRPVEVNLKLIIARLKSGATVMACRQVIAKKTREWNGNVKMDEYLRPATLFNATKFEQYLGECVLPANVEDNDEQN
jgi:uncharacterized phage protein (TIGR02220 family)